jgi:hypothetical protein
VILAWVAGALDTSIAASAAVKYEKSLHHRFLLL